MLRGLRAVAMLLRVRLGSIEPLERTFGWEAQQRTVVSGDVERRLRELPFGQLALLFNKSCQVFFIRNEFLENLIEAKRDRLDDLF